MGKTLFLNLTAFSGTGGLEKFNKCFLKAMHEQKGEENSIAHSAYDTQADERYYPQAQYTGFKGRLPLFIIRSVLQAAKCDEIVVGHINLSLIGCLIKIFYPKKRIILITHGIEVWDMLRGFKKKMLNKADRILSVSTFTKDKLIEQHAVEAGRITVFPNTLDLYFPIPKTFEQDTTLRAGYGIGENDFLLFTLARLSGKEQYKGYDTVIECMPGILKEMPDAKYLIAGKGDEAELERIKSMIARHGLEGKVILAGYIADEKLVAHYQMSDLFIMPSKGEGFGIVYLEAMACGLQVMAGDKDGSVDALQNGALGILVDPGSKGAIVEKVIACAAKYKNRKTEDKEKLQQAVIQQFGFAAFKERLKTILA